MPLMTTHQNSLCYRKVAFHFDIAVSTMLACFVPFRQKQDDGGMTFGNSESLLNGLFAVHDDLVGKVGRRVCGKFRADVLHAFVRGVFFGVNNEIGILRGNAGKAFATFLLPRAICFVRCSRRRFARR